MSAKWPGLPAFLAHLAIGACLAMPVNTFVQYYFNGRLMAQLPQWDASIYSHAVIMPMDVLGVRFTALLCTTEPFTVSNDGYLELQKPTTAILATGVIANRVHVRWKWLEGTNDYDAGVWNALASGVIWSNYDLVDAAGNVYLKASEPVPRAPIPVLPEPDPEPERKPIAYKYNGVQLPDINTVWTDKETYPYAFMVVQDAGYIDVTFAGSIIAVVAFASSRPEYNADKNRVICNTPILISNYTDNKTISDLVPDLNYGLNEWGTPISAYQLYNPIEDGEQYWTSHDILNTDGTVYLAASEPVPVYE